MRVVGIIVVQLAVSVFVMASVMPLVIVAVPAVRNEPRLGFGLMAGIGVVCFALLALVWPWRRK